MAYDNDRVYIGRIEEFYNMPQIHTIRDRWRRIHLSTPRISYSVVGDRIEFLLDKNFDGYEFFSLSLTYDALDSARGIVARLSECDSSLFGTVQFRECRIDSKSHPYDSIYSPIMFVEMQSGAMLSDLLERGEVDGAELCAAIDLLESTLSQFDLSFVDLSPDSVVVGVDGRLYPFKYDNLLLSHGEGCEGCALLRRAVAERCMVNVDESEEVSIDPYPLRETLSSHYRYMGYAHDGCVVVESHDGLWGYVDAMSGREIVKLQYRLAYNFRGGYAVVVSDRGWGLCNVRGEEVIPSINEDLLYGECNDVCALRRDGKWAYFGCGGAQLTPFNVDYPDDRITRLEVAALDGAYSILHTRFCVVND